MFEVRDTDRVLRFDGVKLASSSSKKYDSERWIEFELYRTESGSYILSRIGVSRIYHEKVCSLVNRYNLSEISKKDLKDDAITCQQCADNAGGEYVYPERFRYWAQVSDGPKSVLEALYKYDNDGAKYLTLVAKRLLESASEADKEVEKVYRIEVVL